MQDKPMPGGLHLEGLERVGIMFQDMWCRLAETLEKDKSRTPWWKGVLRILGRKQIMQHKPMPGGLLLDKLERLVKVFKDMWFRLTGTLEKDKSSTPWWKEMLRIRR